MPKARKPAKKAQSRRPQPVASDRTLNRIAAALERLSPAPAPALDFKAAD